MITPKAPALTASGLTQTSFLGLLQWLDNDLDEAGKKYELLRQKLCVFFEHRACPIPEDLADKTLDRVAGKLAADDQIKTNDPASYCYAVANYILKEYWRTPQRNEITLDTEPDKRILLSADSTPGYDEKLEIETRLGYLSSCLQQLPSEDRELITRYYAGEHQDRISNRQHLARDLGISPGSLRIRALRIRKQLSDCLCRCQKFPDGK